MKSWHLPSIDAPDGTRDPVVLHSNAEGRAVMLRIDPGQALGDHQVKERAWISVVEGRVRVDAGGESMVAEQGTLLTFAPNGRRALPRRRGAAARGQLAPVRFLQIRYVIVSMR
jgi:quercetin dioxygenase-like cupin family protein